jgi:hypothetical protein
MACRVRNLNVAPQRLVENLRLRRKASRLRDRIGI